MLIQLVEENTTSIDKNDSELCDIALSEQAETMIVELNAMHGEAKDKVFDLIATLKRDGLKEHQIKQVIFSRVKFISKRRLYEIIPEEYKREYTKPLPKTINISTPHKVIEPVEEYIGSPELEPEQKSYNPDEEIQKIGQMRRELAIKDAEEEDAQALEIQFLKEKVAELEEALKKTQQFTPATQLQQQEPATDEHYFKWLTDKADGIHSFYYDTYGIDLFKNREISQLKNSGVKVFKRLYFEV